MVSIWRECKLQAKKKTRVDQGTQSACSSSNCSLKTPVYLNKFWSSVFLKVSHLAQTIHLDYNIMQLKLPNERTFVATNCQRTPKFDVDFAVYIDKCRRHVDFADIPYCLCHHLSPIVTTLMRDMFLSFLFFFVHLFLTKNRAWFKSCM